MWVRYRKHKLRHLCCLLNIETIQNKHTCIRYMVKQALGYISSTFHISTLYCKPFATAVAKYNTLFFQISYLQQETITLCFIYKYLYWYTLYCYIICVSKLSNRFTEGVQINNMGWIQRYTSLTMTFWSPIQWEAKK